MAVYCSVASLVSIAIWSLYSHEYTRLTAAAIVDNSNEPQLSMEIMNRDRCEYWHFWVALQVKILASRLTCICTQEPEMVKKFSSWQLSLGKIRKFLTKWSCQEENLSSFHVYESNWKISTYYIR